MNGLCHASGPWEWVWGDFLGKEDVLNTIFLSKLYHHYLMTLKVLS